MSDKEIKFDIKSALDMLYLCACALKGEKPRAERIESLNLKSVYAISKFHSLTALTAEGLKFASIEDISEFEKAQMVSLRKTVLFDIERKRLTEFMEEKGIWYMPLKGVILKDMYPTPGLRQMSDNDILFDANHRQTIHDWFVNEGYEVESYESYNHDVYLKKPVYNYEMHVSLYDEHHASILETYYADIKDRLVKDSQNSCGYHFTDEDFYIYFLTHGFKHYDGGGTGVRFLTDIYVYLQNKQSDMDFEYISEELKKLELEEFELNSRELCQAVFNNIHSFNIDSLSEQHREMLTFFLTSGTYGTFRNRINSGIKKSGQIGYIIKRIFPGRSVLKEYHPMFNCILLVPVGWVWRWINRFSLYPKKVMHELKLLFKRNKQ